MFVFIDIMQIYSHIVVYFSYKQFSYLDDN